MVEFRGKAFYTYDSCQKKQKNITFKWLKKAPPTVEEFVWTVRENNYVMEKITTITAPDESVHGESG